MCKPSWCVPSASGVCSWLDFDFILVVSFAASFLGHFFSLFGFVRSWSLNRSLCGLSMVVLCWSSVCVLFFCVLCFVNHLWPDPASFHLSLSCANKVSGLLIDIIKIVFHETRRFLGVVSR